jgi:hypothetical protein
MLPDWWNIPKIRLIFEEKIRDESEGNPGETLGIPCITMVTTGESLCMFNQVSLCVYKFATKCIL